MKGFKIALTSLLKYFLLLTFPRNDTNHSPTFKFDVKSPKHARRIRQHFVTREEPARTKRHTPSKRTHHLWIGRLPIRYSRFDEPLRIERFWVTAKVFWCVVLSVRWTHDVVSYFQGATANRCFLLHNPVGRSGGVKSESFVVKSAQERAGGEKIVYLFKRSDGIFCPECRCYFSA